MGGIPGVEISKIDVAYDAVLIDRVAAAKNINTVVAASNCVAGDCITVAAALDINAVYAGDYIAGDCITAAVDINAVDDTCDGIATDDVTAAALDTNAVEATCDGIATDGVAAGGDENAIASEVAHF